MIGIIITIFIILVLAVIMEISATALRLTGLDIHTARFQALSALTGTGFTTREAELIMNHKQRRIIIMTLMVIGPIGFLSILSSILIVTKEKVVIFQLLSIAVIAFLIMRITKSRRLMVFFHRMIEKQLKKRKYPRRVVLEEVLQLNENYGVCEIKIDEYSPVLNKSLVESDFKEKDCLVLAIERQGNLIPVPKADDIVKKDDILVVFGPIKNISSYAK